jgi:hypothetical protein
MDVIKPTMIHSLYMLYALDMPCETFRIQLQPVGKYSGSYSLNYLS